MTSGYPIFESGYFHLTQEGWVRQDREPFPAARIETWRYEAYVPAEDAKEQVSLTRVWTRRGANGDALHMRFGEPVLPSRQRNVILECNI